MILCPFAPERVMERSCNKCIIQAFKTKKVILWDSSNGSGGGIPIERRSEYMLEQNELKPEVILPTS